MTLRLAAWLGWGCWRQIMAALNFAGEDAASCGHLAGAIAAATVITVTDHMGAAE